jgi:ABC-2 type transport system permease protein
MKWYRIWTMVVRHLIQFPTDFNKLSSVFYWPLINIIVFGFTGSWLNSAASGADENRFILLTGVVLWQVCTRSGYGVSINLLEEIWAQNLTNLFTTPLSIGEWILSTIVEGIIMLAAVITFCAGITFFFYGYNIFSMGLWFFPLVMLIFFSGLSIGFVASSLLIMWGTRIQTIAWIVSWLVAPISGAFYPIEVLPNWLQAVAKLYPLHYIFSCMRITLTSGSCPLHLFAKACAFTATYLVLTLLLFVTMFNKSKKYGLARVSN